MQFEERHFRTHTGIVVGKAFVRIFINIRIKQRLNFIVVRIRKIRRVKNFGKDIRLINI